jgi:hypothetical protein
MNSNFLENDFETKEREKELQDEKKKKKNL